MATQGREIVLDVPNKIGVMAEIAKAVAEKGVGILALAAWSEGGNGSVHLVTDDNLRALGALEKKGFKAREENVVLVELPHKPGLLKNLTEKLQDGRVNIRHLYASARDEDLQCRVIFSSTNNDHAMVVLDR